MLLVRYGNLDYVNRLPLKVGLKLIYKSLEEIDKQKHWEVWVSMYPFFTKDTFISFEQWYKKPIAPQKEKTDIVKVIAIHDDIMKKIANGQFKEVKM